MSAAVRVPAVLVVDDDPEALAFARIALEKHYTVLVATSGADVGRTAREARPAAILLDIMMPASENGFTVFRALGSDPATSNIPVIILSSVNAVTDLPFGPGEMERYLGRAPAAFLQKPVSEANLRRAVAKALRG